MDWGEETDHFRIMNSTIDVASTVACENLPNVIFELVGEDGLL